MSAGGCPWPGSRHGGRSDRGGGTARDRAGTDGAVPTRTRTVNHGLDTAVLATAAGCVILWSLVSARAGEALHQRPHRLCGHGPGRHARASGVRPLQSPLVERPVPGRGHAGARPVHRRLAGQHPRAPSRPRPARAAPGRRTPPDHRPRDSGGLRHRPGRLAVGGRDHRSHRGAHRCRPRGNHHGRHPHPEPDPSAAQRGERPQRRHRHPVRESVPGRCGYHRRWSIRRPCWVRPETCSSARRWAPGSEWSAAGRWPGPVPPGGANPAFAR